MADKAIKKEMHLLSEEDGTWQEFERQWRERCEAYDEEFDSYAEGTFTVIRGLIQKPEPRSAVVGIKHDGRFVSMCQINVTPLPGYTGPVMRVRFMTVSPDYDFGDMPVDDYATVLVSTFAALLVLSDGAGWLSARHLKFHLRSPADRQFFAAFGRALNHAEEFDSVNVRGAWLYLTKAEAASGDASQ